MQPLLKILRRNDPTLLSLVDDLYPDWNVLDQYLKKSEEKVNLQGEIRMKTIRDDKVEQDQEKYIELVKTAIDFGSSSEAAGEVARRVLQSNEAEKELVDLRRQVVEMVVSNTAKQEVACDNEIQNKAEVKEGKKPKAGGGRKAVFDKDDLRSAISENTDATYEKLVEMGVFQLQMIFQI